MKLNNENTSQYELWCIDNSSQDEASGLYKIQVNVTGDYRQTKSGI